MFNILDLMSCISQDTLRSKQSPNDKHINVQLDEDNLYIVVFLGHLHYT